VSGKEDIYVEWIDHARFGRPDNRPYFAVVFEDENGRSLLYKSRSKKSAEKWKKHYQAVLADGILLREHPSVWKL
jgi:hypothetical protein